MPLVSIIVPCYNEQVTIGLLLEAILQQTFPTRDLEVIIADGKSTDQTCLKINDFQNAHPDLEIHLVENARRIIPAGLNCALAVARGKYIVRLDGHSMPAADYIQRCVDELEAGRGDNVGGVWEIRPQGKALFARAIAIAAAHPMGVGDAQYRHARQPGYVDTVPFGAFRREVFERFGTFNETLLTNEDYEFNARLRQGGGRVWLNPLIRSTYFARPNLTALAKQYWRYGYWKLKMLRLYPRTLRWRQFLPPVFVSGLLLLGIIIAVWPFVRPYAAGVLFLGLLLYLLTLGLGSVRSMQREKDAGLLIAVPLAIATMHLSWGSGFWWSMLAELVPYQWRSSSKRNEKNGFN